MDGAYPELAVNEHEAVVWEDAEGVVDAAGATEVCGDGEGLHGCCVHASVSVCVYVCVCVGLGGASVDILGWEDCKFVVRAEMSHSCGAEKERVWRVAVENYVDGGVIVVRIGDDWNGKRDEGPLGEVVPGIDRHCASREAQLLLGL